MEEKIGGDDKPEFVRPRPRTQASRLSPIALLVTSSWLFVVGGIILVWRDRSGPSEWGAFKTLFTASIAILALLMALALIYDSRDTWRERTPFIVVMRVIQAALFSLGAVFMPLNALQSSPIPFTSALALSASCILLSAMIPYLWGFLLLAIFGVREVVKDSWQRRRGA